MIILHDGFLVKIPLICFEMLPFWLSYPVPPQKDGSLSIYDGDGNGGENVTQKVY